MIVSSCSAQCSVTEYRPTIGVSTNGKVLVYKRSFFFGGGGNVVFSAAKYASLKNYFDAVNKADNHTITLKQSAATATNE